MKNRNYTTRLQKGGAILDDIRLIIRSWSENASYEEKGQKIIFENILGKKTKTRSIDVYRRAFNHRFLRGNPPNAWKIVIPLELKNLPIEVIKPVYYWITARSDDSSFTYLSFGIFVIFYDIKGFHWRDFPPFIWTQIV